MVHVSCPLCSKYSSTSSFPAGAGTDILVAKFRGLGRGRGFRLMDRSSALDDRGLCLAVKEKTLQILSTLAAHGYVSPRDVAKAVGLAGERDDVAQVRAAAEHWKGQAAQLTKQREYYEMEIERLNERGKTEARRLRDLEAQSQELNRRLASIESDGNRLLTHVRKLLRKLRGVADDLEYAAMMDENLSDTHEKLTKAIDGFESAADLSSDGEGPEAADEVVDDDEF